MRFSLVCAVLMTHNPFSSFSYHRQPHIPQDISFRVQRQQNVIQRTQITQDFPWKLQQVQDAANHLQQAINHIDNVDGNYVFKSSEEVLHILSNILGALQRGRTSLVVPKKKPIDELMKSRNMKSLSPNLPEDLALSFYIQSHKLIFATYQLTNNQGQMKFESTQAECSVPWLNEVLVLFTVSLTLCQQLKDKVSLVAAAAVWCEKLFETDSEHGWSQFKKIP